MNGVISLPAAFPSLYDMIPHPVNVPIPLLGFISYATPLDFPPIPSQIIWMFLLSLPLSHPLMLHVKSYRMQNYLPIHIICKSSEICQHTRIKVLAIEYSWNNSNHTHCWKFYSSKEVNPFRETEEWVILCLIMLMRENFWMIIMKMKFIRTNFLFLSMLTNTILKNGPITDARIEK